MKNSNNSLDTRVVSVHAKPSKSTDATTGKIVVCSKGFHRTIPAVIFTPEKAEELMDRMEEAYTRVNGYRVNEVF